MCEALKLEMQWKPQELRDAGMWNDCQGKAQAVTRASPSERPLEAAIAKAVGTGLPKPSGVHIGSPHALDAERGATGFNGCPAGFQSCFGLILPFYTPVSHFWNGNAYSVPCRLEVCSLFLILQVLIAMSEAG
jgi:hypothetical protein